MIEINLTDAELIEAFSTSWKEIEPSLDKWKKISIVSSCVFYLSGQCCNESIGLQIESISIKALDKSLIGGWENWAYTAEGTPVNTQEASTRIAGRNLSSAMKVGSYAEELWLGLSLIPTEKKDNSSTTTGTEEGGEGSTSEAGIE
jgi:hypothetical protein